jgi:hypothetical protein
VIAVSETSVWPELNVDEYTKLEKNPGFSVFGCLSLFEKYKYADQAWIIHDSVVLLRKLPIIERFSFIYHFYEPSLDIPRNDAGYKRLLNSVEYAEMTTITKHGCFGNMFAIDYEEIRKIDIQRFIPHIHTKYDFECMERIVGYLALKNGYSTLSVCGDIFDPIANPWSHTEYASLSLDRCIQLNFPEVFLKAIIARK